MPFMVHYNPVFMERGFICIIVWGFALLTLSHFSYIAHENEIIWSHLDQIISFHGIFKTGGGGGGGGVEGTR